jgi:PleD family two-component response regulator
VLLPATDLRDGEAIVDSIHKLVAVNNQFYPGLTLSLSMGVATSGPGERLESVAKRADLLMFEQKRLYYADEVAGSRHAGSTAA